MILNGKIMNVELVRLNAGGNSILLVSLENNDQKFQIPLEKKYFTQLEIGEHLQVDFKAIPVIGEFANENIHEKNNLTVSDTKEEKGKEEIVTKSDLEKQDEKIKFDKEEILKKSNEKMKQLYLVGTETKREEVEIVPSEILNSTPEKIDILDMDNEENSESELTQQDKKGIEDTQPNENELSNEKAQVQVNNEPEEVEGENKEKDIEKDNNNSEVSFENDFAKFVSGSFSKVTENELA